MKFKNFILSLLTIAFVIACNDDDDGDITIEERDRAEQQVVDNDSLLGYFATHYYNADFVESQENLNIFDIVITEAELDDNGNPIVPEGHRLLEEDVITIEDGIEFQETLYTYYILNLNQGGGEEQPNFTDVVRVSYEGFTMDGEIFDSAFTPIDIALVNSAGGGTIEGWRRVFPYFNTAEGFEIVDGLPLFDNYGFGVMFLPSGLGYFSRAQGDIPPYSNLIFKIGLYQTEVLDHDDDLIDSYLEDLDENLNILDDDTDEDGLPNYLDDDDDGDEVLTRNELMPNPDPYIIPPGEDEPDFAENEVVVTRTEESDGTVIIETAFIMDTNNNDIPDYLEEEIAIDYVNPDEEN